MVICSDDADLYITAGILPANCTVLAQYDGLGEVDGKNEGMDV